MIDRQHKITLRDALRLVQSGRATVQISDDMYAGRIRLLYNPDTGNYSTFGIPASWFLGSRATVRKFQERNNWDTRTALRKKIMLSHPEYKATIADLDHLIHMLGADWNGNNPESEDNKVSQANRSADRSDPGQGTDAPESGSLDGINLDDAGDNASDEGRGEADQADSQDNGKGSPSVSGNPSQGMSDKAGSSVPGRVSNATSSASQPCGRGAHPESVSPSQSQPVGRAAGQGTGQSASDNLPAMDGKKPACGASDADLIGASDPQDSDRGSDPDDAGSERPENNQSSESGNADNDPDGNSPTKQGLDELLSNLESKQGSGGEYADFSGGQKPAVTLSRDARQIKIHLEKIFALMDVAEHGDPSPRIKGRPLVRELSSHRINLSRCHREELNHKKIIILVDVSGSCEHVAKDMVAAAVAIYETAPDRLAIIAHSNGCYNPDRGYWEDKIIGLDPKKITRKDRSYGAEPKIYLTGMLHEIAGVVAFGDSDAMDVYQEVTEAGIPFVWLDHQTKSYRDRQKNRSVNVFPMFDHGSSYARQIKAWKRRPIAWFGGVTNGPSAAAALRMIAKDKAKWKR